MCMYGRGIVLFSSVRNLALWVLHCDNDASTMGMGDCEDTSFIGYLHAKQISTRTHVSAHVRQISARTHVRHTCIVKHITWWQNWSRQFLCGDVCPIDLPHTGNGHSSTGLLVDYCPCSPTIPQCMWVYCARVCGWPRSSLQPLHTCT